MSQSKPQKALDLPDLPIYAKIKDALAAANDFNRRVDLDPNTHYQFDDFVMGDPAGGYPIALQLSGIPTFLGADMRTSVLSQTPNISKFKPGDPGFPTSGTGKTSQGMGVRTAEHQKIDVGQFSLHCAPQGQLWFNALMIYYAAPDSYIHDIQIWGWQGGPSSAPPSETDGLVMNRSSGTQSSPIRLENIRVNGLYHDHHMQRAGTFATSPIGLNNGAWVELKEIWSLWADVGSSTQYNMTDVTYMGGGARTKTNHAAVNLEGCTRYRYDDYTFDTQSKVKIQTSAEDSDDMEVVINDPVWDEKGTFTWGLGKWGPYKVPANPGKNLVVQVRGKRQDVDFVPIG